MGELTRRRLLAAAVTASGIALVPGIAWAQREGQVYRLLVEEGVDAFSVRTLLTGHLGPPGSVGRIASDVASRPGELAAIAGNGRRTIVVAGPPVIAALRAAVPGRGTPNPRIGAELARILPAATLEILVFA